MRRSRELRDPIGCRSATSSICFAILRSMVDGIATPHMRITADKTIWDGPITLANVANGPWIGGMFHIAPRRTQ